MNLITIQGIGTIRMVSMKTLREAKPLHETDRYQYVMTKRRLRPSFEYGVPIKNFHDLDRLKHIGGRHVTLQAQNAENQGTYVFVLFEDPETALAFQLAIG